MHSIRNACVFNFDAYSDDFNMVKNTAIITTSNSTSSLNWKLVEVLTAPEICIQIVDKATHLHGIFC
jgi:hypothetical protein